MGGPGEGCRVGPEARTTWRGAQACTETEAATPEPLKGACMTVQQYSWLCSVPFTTPSPRCDPSTTWGEDQLCGTHTCHWVQSSWAQQALQEISSFQAGSSREACSFCPGT